MKSPKILFLTPYPQGAAPSQRFRFEQYYDVLTSKGFEIDIEPFWDVKAWNVLYAKGKFLSKVKALLIGYHKRLKLLDKINEYDFVFIHRETDPLGKSFYIKKLRKKFKGKIIFDFDDAIWLHNTSDSNKMFSNLKNYGNTANICKYSDVISCGNEYLRQYASQFNPNTRWNPTTIDLKNWHNKQKQYKPDEIFVIGWTGSHSTIKYLYFLKSVVQKLEQEFDIQFHVICDKTPQFDDLKSFKFIKWSKETEVASMLNFSVGVMPLEEDKWSNGKCGFKALQYMSVGVPAIVSPVGVNTSIVKPYFNGYICRTEEEWYSTLKKCILNPEVLVEMGVNARKTIESKYSVEANSKNFLELFV